MHTNTHPGAHAAGEHMPSPQSRREKLPEAACCAKGMQHCRQLPAEGGCGSAPTHLQATPESAGILPHSLLLLLCCCQRMCCWCCNKTLARPRPKLDPISRTHICRQEDCWTLMHTAQSGHILHSGNAQPSGVALQPAPYCPLETPIRLGSLTASTHTNPLPLPQSEAACRASCGAAAPVGAVCDRYSTATPHLTCCGRHRMPCVIPTLDTLLLPSTAHHSASW